jgi:hypothetical protein
MMRLRRWSDRCNNDETPAPQVRREARSSENLTATGAKATLLPLIWHDLPPAAKGNAKHFDRSSESRGVGTHSRGEEHDTATVSPRPSGGSTPFGTL